MESLSHTCRKENYYLSPWNTRLREEYQPTLARSDKTCTPCACPTTFAFGTGASTIVQSWTTVSPNRLGRPVVLKIVSWLWSGPLPPTCFKYRRQFISFSQVQGHGHASEAVAMAKIRGDMKRMVVRAWLGWAIGKDLLGLKGKESI